MRLRLAWSFVTFFLCASCTRSGGSSSANPPPVPTATAAGAKDPCDPATLSLGHAKSLAAWKVPDGCVSKGISMNATPTLIRSEQEFREHFTCSATAASGVDFTNNDLAVSLRTLSPAGIGYGVADDGTKVTTIARQRASCPNDPMPMPMQTVQAYLLPSHATRVFAEVACTVTLPCR